MVAVALAEAAALAVVVVSLVGVIARMQRAHARREDLLINQLLHAAGRSWQRAPAETAGESARQDLPLGQTFTASPEQLPVE